MSSILRAKLLNGVATAAVSVSIALGTVSIAPPDSALAFYCANCSTFYQQMYQYAEQVNIALSTGRQLEEQIKQYQNMVTQGMSLPNSMFSSVTGDLQRVVNLYNQSQSLGRQVQDMDTAFNTQFPDFQTYLQAASNKESASQMMPQRYQKWADQGRDNVKTSLEAANLNTSTFQSEDTRLAQMVARSQSAAGRMQAIQAGNEIAAQNVQQLQKLRDLLATQINMQGNYMAQLQDRQRADDAFRQQWRSGTIVQTGRTKGY